ncbi:MAG: 2-polyprenylphenol 6-hydroxylase [Parvibaculaceae bacterium]
MRSLRNIFRLIRAGRILARYDALFPPEFEDDVPPIVKAGRAVAAVRLPWEAKPKADGSIAERLSTALQTLGPSYIKLGQFLATRPDIIGTELAGDLGMLRDRLPPFDQSVAVATIESELGAPISELYVEFGEPVAAASIAQVHKASIAIAERTEGDGPEGLTYRDVAVKVLRPGVETRFAQDLDSFFWIAETVEKRQPAARRLRPVEVVQTLADSVELEMDLRLEAAAMSEMAQNTAHDTDFRVPEIDWERTSRRVMTLEWVDGTPATDRDALVAAGHDMAALGTRTIQTFLTHALRDGFFHADMHQGNLFVDPDGTLVAVDFGIMGRLDQRSRRFLAEILYGFVRRDYRRVAEIHFEAGYVPDDKNIDTFAQALRSIGEPIFGKTAKDVSMGRLLAQLFLVTDQFDMATRPELILLQKTMVVVEGVARHFDPEHNIWDSAEPILAAWMAERLGPEGRIQDAADGAAALGRAVTHLPDFLDRADRVARQVSESVDRDGIRLHPSTADAIARAQSNRNRWSHAALWVGAASLFVLALTAVV